ncbi:hypothetical protein HY387_01030 [Candidatus Daviesbacteria bacterium]|nr:hypothetical protein [Candidatus Daviesbacteria bacterium]
MSSLTKNPTKKIPGWKLPGAIGWEGWPDAVDVETEISREPEPVLDPAKKVLGTLFFNTPTVFDAILDIIPSYILQKEPAPPPSPEAEQKRAEGSFMRERTQRLTAEIREVKVAKHQEVAATAQRVSDGAISYLDVLREVFVNTVPLQPSQPTNEGPASIGKNEVMVVWQKRQAQMKEAEKAQQTEKLVSVKPSRGFTMGQGELLKGGENPQHFTRSAG